MHNYYAQPIYYTYVSKCCESLTDWSIPSIELCLFQGNVYCRVELERLPLTGEYRQGHFEMCVQDRLLINMTGEQIREKMSSDDASFLLADAEQPMNALVSCLKSNMALCLCIRYFEYTCNYRFSKCIIGNAKCQKLYTG